VKKKERRFYSLHKEKKHPETGSYDEKLNRLNLYPILAPLETIVFTSGRVNGHFTRNKAKWSNTTLRNDGTRFLKLTYARHA